jgi:chemotaxis protein methyltransferase CheR
MDNKDRPMRDSDSSSHASLDILMELIHERTGIFYENGRRDLVADKLFPLMAERGSDSFLDYYYLLKYGSDADAEWRRVETALAVNETYFWREFGQIRTVVNVIVPELQKQYPRRPVRIWHAACATGEEPYTLAIALLEANRYAHGPIEIVGTDFNTEAIAQARAGMYRGRSFRSIPSEILERYFVPGERGKYQLNDQVRALVEFSYLNLKNEDAMQKMRDFDVIFCRNVFIYFSYSAIQHVIDLLYQSLRSPGFVFVAAAESLLRVNTELQLVEIEGAFAYKKGEL